MADRIRILLAAFASIVALAFVVAPVASAQSASVGSVSIKVDKKAAKALKADKLKLSGAGGAEVRGRNVSLPVSDGTVGATAQLTNSGVLKLTAKRTGGKTRSVQLRHLRTVIADGAGYATARYRGQQVTLLTIGSVGDAPYDPLTGRISVSGATVRFDSSVTGAIADRLGVKKLRAKLGAVSIDATVAPAPVDQTAAQIRPRPATAVDVVGGSLTWRARTSWVDYLHAAGAQGGTSTSNGATDGPAEVIPPSSQARVYQYDFPFASGWYDAASDTANVGFNGTVTFFKKVAPFNIDLDTQNPVVELGGPKPQMIATLNGRQNNSDQVNRPAVTVDLNQSAVTPTATPGLGGVTTYSWTSIPGLNPDGVTAWPIAGYYQPGDAWGSVTVSFTVGP